MLKKRERERVTEWKKKFHNEYRRVISNAYLRLSGWDNQRRRRQRWDEIETDDKWNNRRKERRQKNESWDGSGAGSVFFGVYLLILFFKFIFKKANYNLPVVVWSKFKSLNCNLKFDILPPSSWLKFKLFLCVLKSDVSVMLYCFLSYLILYFYVLF